MKCLYRFECSFRGGTLSGIFVEKPSVVDNAIGERIYLGEVLGKHSEVVLELEESHFELLTDDQDFISQFEDLNCATGYNPIDYIEENEDDEEEEELNDDDDESDETMKDLFDK
jgi:hypothetical protein